MVGPRPLLPQQHGPDPPLVPPDIPQGWGHSLANHGIFVSGIIRSPGRIVCTFIAELLSQVQDSCVPPMDNFVPFERRPFHAGICRDHDLGKPRRAFAQITPPSINLPRDDIPSSRDLAYRSAWRKGFRNNRSLLFQAPPPAPLRARQHFNSAHHTVSCTSATTVLAPCQKTARNPAPTRRPLSDRYDTTT